MFVNGDFYSHADITLRAQGLQFAGMQAVNYHDKLGRQYVRGTARVPLGMTSGQYEAGGDLTFYLPAFNFLILSLSLLGLLSGGWRRFPFTLTVSYGSQAGPISIPTITDTIPGVLLTDIEASQSESLDPLQRKVSFMTSSQIQWSGIPSIIETSTLAAVA
jgi:hypothetical protein